MVWSPVTGDFSAISIKGFRSWCLIQCALISMIGGFIFLLVRYCSYLIQSIVLILHRKATENFCYPNLPIIHILKSLLDQKQLGCSVFMVICVPDTVVNVTEPSFEK